MIISSFPLVVCVMVLLVINPTATETDPDLRRESEEVEARKSNEVGEGEEPSTTQGTDAKDGSSTPKPTDWQPIYDNSIKNWKKIVGNYGTLTLQLRKRGYNLEPMKGYLPSAIQAGWKTYDKNMKDFNSTMVQEIRKLIEEALDAYPEGDWNVTLVDKMTVTIGKYEKEPQEAVGVLGPALVSLLGLRREMERQMHEVPVEKQPEARDKKKAGDLAECVEAVYQGLIRGHYGPCDDASERFYKRCQPYCQATFENKAPK